MGSPLRELVILGSGPAGLTAAIYAGRAGLSPVVITGLRSGGRLTIPPLVENFPGFPEGIDGPALMNRTMEQAKRFGATFVFANAGSVDLRSRPFTVVTDEASFQCKAIVIATGADTSYLGLPKEREMIGRGISTCATCDGFFFRDRVVFVIGGGDTAMEDAIFLSRYARKVTVVHRRSQLRASKILQDQALANPKISFVWDSVVAEFIGDEVIEGVKLRNVKTGGISEHPCDGVFLAIGHIPNTGLFRGQLDLDEQGYIVTKGPTQTNVEGIFAAGDVVDKVYRQAITAAASGCMAALDAERWLALHT